MAGAKRFTDSGKWKRPWFRKLSLEGKVLWQYLCDECDHAGFFIADFELVSFQVGFKVDESKLALLLGDKLVKVEPDKYFIPSFYEFQYADAKPGFKAKQSAIKILRSYGLMEESSDSFIDLSNSYLTVPEQSADCPSIGIGKSKGKSKKGSAEGKHYSPEFDAAWEAYPRKEDKGDAFRAFEANVTPEEYPLVLMAIANYREKLARDKTEAKFIKLGATFFNKGRWRDCLEPGYGEFSGFDPQSPPDPDLSDIFGGSK